MFLDLFSVKKPIIGMLHLIGDTPAEKIKECLKEAAIYKKCGVDAMLLEDYFGSREDVVACMKALSQEDDYLYGANVLDNFSFTYEMTSMYGGKFMQVDSVCGHLPVYLDAPYAEMIAAYRKAGTLPIIGGVRFKYQPSLSCPAEAWKRICVWACSAAMQWPAPAKAPGLKPRPEKLRSSAS